MKKNLFSLLTVLGVAVLGTACSSANSEKTAPPPPEPKLTADQVLTKAEEKAKATVGQKWENNMEMQMKLPEGVAIEEPTMPSNLNMKMNSTVELVGKEKFYVKTNMLAGGGPISVNLEMDLFSIDKMLYVKENMTNKWMKAKVDSDKDFNEVLDLVQADPFGAETLADMKKNIGLFQFQEEANSYRFSVEALDPVKAKELTKVLESGLGKGEEDFQEDLQKFSISVVIDKKTFQVTEANADMSLEMNDPDMGKMSADAKLNTKFVQEIQDISPLPEEAKNAKEEKLKNLEMMLEEQGGFF